MTEFMTKYSIPSLNRKALSQIGLAMRAGKLVTGDQLMKSIRSNECSLVVIANDASTRTKKQLSSKCEFYKIHYVVEFTIEELSKAIGKNNRVAVGLIDSNFKKMILKDYEEVNE